MARQISPNRLKALKIWLQSGRNKRPKEIADELGISASQVRKWKCIDKWDDIPDNFPKRGAPYRNKNAIGNKGGGAPEGNQNALKHGMFKRWLPEDDELQEIYEAARDGMSTLDIVYEEILIMFTNFIRAQKIMYVKDQDDMTQVVKKQKSYSDNKSSSEEIEYEIQHAWDKQAKALTSQAAAMAAISRKIKQYEELLRTLPPEEVKEEHRLRINKIKVDIDTAKQKAW
ncbi:phage terminase small subunit [Caldibacillus thermoamylovorans]|uniref:phage terminase small subunit n=1 Tax=Caldibacillus thermoamylovorans TaxID=35841 RepID=UPI002041E4FA|nr:phage terminase small subunit [Caldibacillus thermoamylovorans]MCM3053682.1 phage terminase small subunit [Caldibacillus thermoamylovorans]